MKKRDVKKLKGMFATKQAVTVEEMNEKIGREAAGDESKFIDGLKIASVGDDSDFERTSSDE